MYEGVHNEYDKDVEKRRHDEDTMEKLLATYAYPDA